MNHITQKGRISQARAKELFRRMREAVEGENGKQESFEEVKCKNVLHLSEAYLIIELYAEQKKRVGQ